MRAALRARKAEAEHARDMALLSAYFAGAGGYLNIDPRKAPRWAEFHAKMTTPPRPMSGADLMARFSDLAARGFDVTVTKH